MHGKPCACHVSCQQQRARPLHHLLFRMPLAEKMHKRLSSVDTSLLQVVLGKAQQRCYEAQLQILVCVLAGTW